MNRVVFISKWRSSVIPIVNFFCERFITKEQRRKHLFSSRHLRREVYGYRPAFFPQRKLTRDENSTLEKAFREMIFGTVKPVFGFLKTYIMMVTIMKDGLKIADNDDDAVFRYNYRDTMIAQFKQDLYNKNFSLQHHGYCGENDTLQKKIRLLASIY